MPQRKKLKVARLSIISNTVLTLGKLAAGFSMNSISVISEGIHSGLDLMAALIAYAAVRESSKPADDKHRYGHGKFENLAAILEALLILLAAALIIKEAVPKIYHATAVTSLSLGIIVMGVSALINLYVSSRLMLVAKETDSPALAADAWHLRTDVYTSVGVLAGIVMIKITGLYIIDPIIAIGVSLLIVKAAYDLIRESIGSILDVRLPDQEEKMIREILHSFQNQYIAYKNLRTRKAGSRRYIDFTLVVPRGEGIANIHVLCDSIKSELLKRIADAEIIISPEPCTKSQSDCDLCKMQLHYCLFNEEVNHCDKCKDTH